jgi:hypothetical protein
MERSLLANTCSLSVAAKRLTLSSPAFAFTLDTANGLRAVAWENRLTGKTLELGNGPEVEFDVGLPDKPVITPRLRVTRMPAAAQGATGEAVFELTSDEPAATVTVTYRWDAKQPVLRKFVTINNTGTAEWDRLLNARLGTYKTGAAQLSGGELVVWPESFRGRAHVCGGLQGFPVYAEGEFFLSLAHPAGWNTQEPGEISLRHYPGARLPPGGRHDCMEAVYGVGQAGGGREAFVSYVRSRMRRTVRGHDKPYAIFEPFGGRMESGNPAGDYDETEAFVLDMIRKVAQGQRDSNCRFDVFSVDFWVDHKGDIKRADPTRFPGQFENIKAALAAADLKLGLWIDSTSCGWSIGGNPATRPAIDHDVEQDYFNRDPWAQFGSGGWFCRATEPIRSMYTDGFLHHIRENGARLLKFDNFRSQCSNPNHAHLPGVYGNEATHEAVIECYRALDAECPDVFIMLYWGYRSPWWLLYGDTMFETGVEMEASSPGHISALYVRDGVTRKLDQGHAYAKDVPWLGTDSLGILLSTWSGWNSGIGPERWQGAFVMDILRGHLLAQPWSDPDWLTPPERRQMGEFIALMRAAPACFGNSRLILGDPWNEEPYGYCGTDGTRAFLAINNSVWHDSVLKLQLNAAWGLPDGRRWDLYRWYPRPARLTGEARGFGSEIGLALRPFEVVLLEAVPHGEKPSLPREFAAVPLPLRFAEASRAIALSIHGQASRPVQKAVAGPTPGRDDLIGSLALERPAATGTQAAPQLDPAVWKPLVVGAAKSAGGATLTVQPDGYILASGATPSPDTYNLTARAELSGITGILLEALPHESLPGKGPGRAVNGNFMLVELRLKAGPADGPSVAVALRDPVADFEQTSHGGWPVAATLDGNPKTGWSIDPQEGAPHAALFRTAAPVGPGGGTVLTVEIDTGEREHSLGRLRLWVTAAEKPTLPAGYGRPRSLIVGELPATPSGGVLAVTPEVYREGKPIEWANFGHYVEVEGSVAGAPAALQPAISPTLGTYPSSWQTWRLEVPPGSSARPLQLALASTLPADAEPRLRAHFLPTAGE